VSSSPQMSLNNIPRALFIARSISGSATSTPCRPRHKYTLPTSLYIPLSTPTPSPFPYLSHPYGQCVHSPPRLSQRQGPSPCVGRAPRSTGRRIRPRGQTSQNGKRSSSSQR
jgi:hypothetical protein